MPEQPFDAHTTYNDQYQAHAMEPRAVMAARPQLPHTKFEGTTTYHVRFLLSHEQSVGETVEASRTFATGLYADQQCC